MFHTPEITLIGFDYLNKTKLEEMRRNLSLLYETVEGSCPGDRHFGLNPSFLDAPMNVAINLFALEVIEKTEIYEEKAEIVNIEYEHSADGNLTPKLVIGQKEVDVFV